MKQQLIALALSTALLAGSAAAIAPIQTLKTN